MRLAVTRDIIELALEYLGIHFLLSVLVHQLRFSNTGRSDQHHIVSGVYKSVDQVAVADRVICVPESMEEYAGVLLEVK